MGRGSDVPQMRFGQGAPTGIEKVSEVKRHAPLVQVAGSCAARLRLSSRSPGQGVIPGLVKKVHRVVAVILPYCATVSKAAKKVPWSHWHKVYEMADEL